MFGRVVNYVYCQARFSKTVLYSLLVDDSSDQSALAYKLTYAAGF